RIRRVETFPAATAALPVQVFDSGRRPVMRTHRLAALAAALALLAPAAILAQGPGSCGFHLDVIANLTSTHAAGADSFAAPGSGPFGIPAGAPGNPYVAHCTPGTVIKLELSVPGGVLGPGPFGAGSIVSILWAVGTPNVAIAPGPGMIPPCVPGQPL